MSDEDEGAIGRTISTAIAEAIEQIIQQHEHGFVIKWVAVLETAGEDGTRGVWTSGSRDVMPWDALGLLEYGKQRWTKYIDGDL